MPAFYMSYGNDNRAVEYTKKELKGPSIVKILFDYCQIYEGYISHEGWQYLIEFHGYNRLFDIDKESGLFNCKNIEEYKVQVDYEKNLAKITALDECGNIW